MIEIQGRLARADGVDAALIIALDRQTHEIPLLDRRFGAATILDRISAHINMVHELMTHTILTKDRQALARIIADAAAIADWQASISVTTGTYVDVIEQVQRAAVSGMDSLLSPAR